MQCVPRRPIRWLLSLGLLLAAFSWVAAPYLRAASLVVRAANLGGRVEMFAASRAARVQIEPPHEVPTRYGGVAAQFYLPLERTDRSVLLIPGIHSLGIREPRLMALAEDLAASRVTVMTMALPDLQGYRITPQSTDIIEDAVAWMAARPNLAPDGRIGVIGISFAGGLSLVAAGRPAIRDRLAYVVSFGGHGDLKRTMRYLASGTAPAVPGLTTRPPHDYGVAVLLHAAADRLVPPPQIAPLRHGIETFLLASQLTLVDAAQAEATFDKARHLAGALPEPAATYLTWVNDRNVAALGPVLLPWVEDAADDPDASAEHAPTVPAAPVFLLHGDDDTVIPAAESVLLAEHLRMRGATVHLLLSGLITHAEVNRSAAAADAWKLVRFWADILSR